MRLSCALWGHQVDNRVFSIAPADRRCRCGASYLADDGSLTRVRHTLACFLGKHTYTPLADRDGCREYVCIQCGHPLVFRNDADPYRQTTGFRKKVRYLCGLFGHRVAAVTSRDGCVEYACHCGHSFLKDEPQPDKIRHPMMCVLKGHYIRFLTARHGYDEFVCINCGHPFCFVGAVAERRTEHEELRTQRRTINGEPPRRARNEEAPRRTKREPALWF